MVAAVGEIVRRARFDLYGLPPSFQGLRWVAEHDTVPSVLVLGHGDPRASPEAWVKVGVILKSDDGPTGEDSGRIDIYDTLALTLLAAQGASEHRTDRRDWRTIKLAVEHFKQDFLYLDAGNSWIAFRELLESWLYVHSFGFGRHEVELVPVNADAYLDGLARLQSPG